MALDSNAPVSDDIKPAEDIRIQIKQAWWRNAAYKPKFYGLSPAIPLLVLMSIMWINFYTIGFTILYTLFSYLLPKFGYVPKTLFWMIRCRFSSKVAMTAPMVGTKRLKYQTQYN